MKLKKDTLYTIIDTDFEKLHIYPDSGYTVWEKYDPQRNCNWWAAFRTGQVQDLIESCIVESDDDDDDDEEEDDDIEFYADDITAALEAGLEDGRYTAIIYDGSDPDSPEAFYVSEDEVDEENGLPEPGDYLYLPGQGTFKTSEKISTYYLFYDDCDGTMYFSEGFSKPPESIDRFIIPFDNDEYNY